MVQIRRAVRPLVSARQRCHAKLRVEGEGVAHATGLTTVQRVIHVLQLRADEVPIVQCLLHAAGNAGGVLGVAEVTRDDDELAIARAIFVSCEFHVGIVISSSYGECKSSTNQTLANAVSDAFCYGFDSAPGDYYEG